MTFPTDPLDPANSARDRVRILVGDIDTCDIELDNALYDYFLIVNNDDEDLAAVQALKALVAKYAKAMSEAVGDQEINLKQRYEGYNDLLDKFLKDPAFGILGVISPYAGGLSFSEKRTDAVDSDLRGSRFTVGSASRRARQGYDAPFFKNIDILFDSTSES
ncbi:MAG: hypothetical protein GWO20_05315 [Candidatus Korarchaeota archaeon]|nr:hypothetical protein [Candidatus Korarchaeota archaeon]